MSSSPFVVCMTMEHESEIAMKRAVVVRKFVRASRDRSMKSPMLTRASPQREFNGVKMAMMRTIGAMIQTFLELHRKPTCVAESMKMRAVTSHRRGNVGMWKRQTTVVRAKRSFALTSSFLKRLVLIQPPLLHVAAPVGDGAGEGPVMAYDEDACTIGGKQREHACALGVWQGRLDLVEDVEWPLEAVVDRALQPLARPLAHQEGGVGKDQAEEVRKLLKPLFPLLSAQAEEGERGHQLVAYSRQEDLEVRVLEDVADGALEGSGILRLAVNLDRSGVGPLEGAQEA